MQSGASEHETARKRAAKRLGSGKSLAVAARAAGVAEATVSYWLAADATFRLEVEIARMRAVRRGVKRMARLLG